MSMFEVTGWSVGAKPVKETRGTPSKKRKRSNNESQPREVNFDKIMEKLKSTVGVDETRKDKTKSAKRSKPSKSARPKSGVSDVGELNISRPKPLKPRISVDEESTRPAKKAKTKRNSVSPTSIVSTLSLSLPGPTSAPTNLTPLQQGMRHSLDGARFRLVSIPPNFGYAHSHPLRMINETLYKSESREAHRLMQQDRKVFDEVCLDVLPAILSHLHGQSIMQGSDIRSSLGRRTR